MSVVNPVARARGLFARLPATERRALVFSVFAAACICFAPAEIISGVLLVLVSYVLYRWDLAISETEAKAAALDAPPHPEALPPES